LEVIYLFLAVAAELVGSRQQQQEQSGAEVAGGWVREELDLQEAPAAQMVDFQDQF
jgi:hypothetical protein